MQHFAGFFFDHRNWYMQKTPYSSETFTAELWYAYKIFGLKIPVENILISVFWIDCENSRFLHFKSGTNLVTDRILRPLWSHSLTCA